MDEPESLRSDLMDSVQDATPHQLAADPATGRTTVYIETSKVGQIKSGHLPAARSAPLPIPADDAPPLPDLIGRRFAHGRPDVAWVGDIT